MQQWETAKPTGTCSVSGRQLEEGEEYYAVFFEEGDSFRRVDYSLESWDGQPANAFCFFKTRVPIQEEKKKKLFVDDGMLINFFERLASETEPVRLQFRFVLALILMRKRILRYEETVRDDGAELWQMRLVKEKSLHRVLNPHLTDEQIAGVSIQLGAILNGDFDDHEDVLNAHEADASSDVSADDVSNAPVKEGVSDADA